MTNRHKRITNNTQDNLGIQPDMDLLFDLKQDTPYDIFINETQLTNEHHTPSYLIDVKEYNIYLNRPFEEPFRYNGLFNLIRTATGNDIINLYLNGIGGNLFTAMQLKNALDVSSADIYGIADGELCSAHTLIFLSCRNFVVHDSSLFMFHNFTSGTYGKGNEQKAEIFAITEWFEKVVKEIYVPFLTEEEFSRIVRGEDLWMLSEEVSDRLLRLKEKNNQPTDNQITDNA